MIGVSALLAGVGGATGVVVLATGSPAGQAATSLPVTPPAAPPPATAPDPGSSAEPGTTVARPAKIHLRKSRSRGSHTSGRLRRGVQLPASGVHYTTWDPILRRGPNRHWRRWGHDRALRTILRVIKSHRKANPGSPRVLVGDISRPRGGDFGIRYGKPGHASHQIGLDVDIYYPRRDRREIAPTRFGHVDPVPSQDLVSRFVSAGATFVFVGPKTGLRGPRRVVMPLAHHDNHLHVRFPAQPDGR